MPAMTAKEAHFPSIVTPFTVDRALRHCGLDQGDCGSMPAMTAKEAHFPSIVTPFTVDRALRHCGLDPQSPQHHSSNLIGKPQKRHE